MSLIKNIKETLSSQKNLTWIRYKSSRIVFIWCTLFFTINYFFSWAGFYYDISVRILPFTYVLFILSFFYVIYFLIKDRFVWKISWRFFFLLYIFLGILSLLLLLPIIYWIWKLDFLKSLLQL